jgi:NADH-quinone oxidoreductase subunit M
VGVILGACYMLWLVQRLFYGPENPPTAAKPAADLGIGELAILTPLVVLMLVMGVAPSLWTDIIQTGVHPPAAQQVQTIETLKTRIEIPAFILRAEGQR